MVTSLKGLMKQGPALEGPEAAPEDQGKHHVAHIFSLNFFAL